MPILGLFGMVQNGDAMISKIFGVSGAIVIIALAVLLATEKLVWQGDGGGEVDVIWGKVKDSAEILKPYTIEIAGEELVVMPSFSIKGEGNWKYDNKIYRYDEETKQLIQVLR